MEPEHMVAQADLILRVRVNAFLGPEHIHDPIQLALLKRIMVRTQQPPDPNNHTEHTEVYGAVQIEVLDVLTGTTATVGEKLKIVGQVSQYHGKNRGTVPYRSARLGADHTGCTALDYAIGREYLLLMQEGSLHWARLAPVNEEVSGPNDPWVKWVKRALKKLPRDRPKPKPKGLPREDPLIVIQRMRKEARERMRKLESENAQKEDKNKAESE